MAGGGIENYVIGVDLGKLDNQSKQMKQGVF